MAIITTIQTVGFTSHNNLPTFMAVHNINPLECGLVRVTDVGKKFNSISSLPFHSILSLHFDDVEEGDGLPHIITTRQAELILNFLIDNHNAIKHLMVCCDGGVSRSAAIAAAIRLKLGMCDWGIWQDGSVAPNMTVFKLLVDVFGVPILDEEIERRDTINTMHFNKHNDLN